MLLWRASRLPREIVEEILLFASSDYVFATRYALVCRQWLGIVRTPRFTQFLKTHTYLILSVVVSGFGRDDVRRDTTHWYLVRHGDIDFVRYALERIQEWQNTDWCDEEWRTVKVHGRTEDWRSEYNRSPDFKSFAVRHVTAESASREDGDNRSHVSNDTPVDLAVVDALLDAIRFSTPDKPAFGLCDAQCLADGWDPELIDYIDDRLGRLEEPLCTKWNRKPFDWF